MWSLEIRTLRMKRLIVNVPGEQTPFSQMLSGKSRAAKEKARTPVQKDTPKRGGRAKPFDMKGIGVGCR
jgi:hypothetical protein